MIGFLSLFEINSWTRHIRFSSNHDDPTKDNPRDFIGMSIGTVIDG